MITFKTTYEIVKADHEYLWSISPAYDMTGGYVDQGDLAKLLDNPTKATARECLVNQINYWFEVGPEHHGPTGDWYLDRKLLEIAERHDSEVKLIHWLNDSNIASFIKGMRT